jgi:hypothetical protein
MIRPDRLVDLLDDDRLDSVNVRYIPLGKRGVNRLYPLAGVDPNYNSKAMSLGGMFILDARNDNGWYDYGGRTHTTDSLKDQDYNRLGGRFGANLTLKGLDLGQLGQWTLGLTNSYTDLASLSGSAKTIAEYQSSLKVSPDALSAVSFAAQYRNGRREDTGARDQAWTFGVTGQY